MLHSVVFIIFCISSFLLCAAQQHLLSPSPWNFYPTPSFPCGGGYALTAPQRYWESGSTAQISWRIIGNQTNNFSLDANVDPSGGTSFTVNLLFNATIEQTGVTLLTVTVPNLTCTGINGTCSLQVSSGGWYECSSISIVPPCQNCTPEIVPPPTCVTAETLNFCTHMNNSKISLKAGYSYTNLDLMVEKVYTNYSLFPYLVNASSEKCQSVMKIYLCDSVFPPCEGSSHSLCEEKCSSFISECGVIESYQSVYNCSSLSKCPNNRYHEYDMVTMAVGITIVLVVVIAFVLNFLVCPRRVRTGYSAIQ